MYGLKKAQPAAKQHKGKQYKHGGLINGPGTGTSDSIEAKIPRGSYIMPADSTEQVGPESLEQMGAQAAPGGMPDRGAMDVRVSNGEFEIPPEQVHAVGAQVLDQIKGKTHTPAGAPQPIQHPQDMGPNFADGGVVESTEEMVARISAKYGTSRMPTAPNPKAVTPNPAPPPPSKPQTSGLNGVVDAMRNRTRRIDEAAGYADGGLVEDERRRLLAGATSMSYGDVMGKRAPAAPATQAPGTTPAAYGGLRREPNIPRTGTPRQMPQGSPLQIPTDTATTELAGPPTPPVQQGAQFADLRREPNVPRTGEPRQMPQGAPLGLMEGARNIAAGGQAATDQIAGVAQAVASDFSAGGRAATNQIGGLVRRASAGQPPAENYSPEALGQPAPPAQQAPKPGYEDRVNAIPGPSAAQLAATGQSPAAAVPSPSVSDAYPDESRRGLAAAGARGISPTSPQATQQRDVQGAPGVTRYDNVRGLKSPLYTNLPGAQAIDQMQGSGGVSTISGPSAQELSERADRMAALREQNTALRDGLNFNAGNALSRQTSPAEIERQLLTGASRSGRQVAAGLIEGRNRVASDQQRQATDQARLGLDRQRTEAELKTRGIEARALERLERLHRQYEEAQTPEARQQIAEQIRAIGGKDAPNRFTVVPGGQEIDPVTQQLVTRPSMVINNQTGQLVDLSGAKPALPPIDQNPAVQKIMANTALSREERAAQIRALGYK